jgi:maleate cis-trans isomerase
VTIRHFGVLIPSTNTTVESECRLLPPAYLAHFGRLMSSGGSFSPSRDEDIDYQSRLLGTAKVELIILAQTSASLFADDYDDVVTKRMSAGAGASAITSAQAVGRAVRALGARRIAIVSPYSVPVNERAARYFETRHGLETIALEGLARPTPTRSASSDRRTRTTPSPASTGRRSRRSWCPAAIPRRCRRSRPGSASSASLS